MATGITTRPSLCALGAGLALATLACTGDATPAPRPAPQPVPVAVSSRPAATSPGLDPAREALRPPAASPDRPALLQRANNAAAGGRLDEALDILLWLFDHGLDEDRSFLGQWAYEVPASLGALAGRYQPAAAAADVRLTRLEDRVLAGPGPDFAPVLGLVNLAASLGKAERVTTLFDRLRGRPPSADDAQYALIRWGFDIFFGAGRYADVSSYAERLADDLSSIYPVAAVGALAGPAVAGGMRDDQTRQVARVFFALLRTGHPDRAWNVADRITTRHPTLATYAQFVDFAARAGAVRVAKRLVAKAKAALTDEQYDALKAASP